MKELQEAKEAYAKLAEAIATMEAKQKDAPWPKVGDKYWSVTTRGSIDFFVWEGSNWDVSILSISNVFRTESDAQKELETRKTIAEFRAQPGRVKFIKSNEIKKWSVIIINDNVVLDYWWLDERGFVSTYFDSLESAKAAINTVGADRLLAASKWLSMGE